jgi:tRNA dimethylallyltransferase
MNPLVAIVGPTGIGKSQLALRLAQDFNGEIVSADSRQVYRYMDIGTAKPSRQEQALIPHHLIDLVNPDEDFTLAQYQQLAYRAIDEIQRRRKLPLLVGGSGLYIWSVIEGWGIPPVPPDLELRRHLERKAAEVGADKLYQELVEADPVAAQRIDQHNVRRITRALEVYRKTRTPFSPPQRRQIPPFNTLIIGLTTDRSELYRSIDIRVDEMVNRGLVEEVKRLVAMGYDFSLPAMSGIGYQQIGMFLRGELAQPVATQQIKFETHRLARRQYNWFQLKDKRINWFAPQLNPNSEITTLVAEFTSSA